MKNFNMMILLDKIKNMLLFFKNYFLVFKFIFTLNFFKEFLLFSFGCIICIFFLYIRLIIERLPGKITFNWNTYIFIMYVILFIIYIYIIYIKVYPRPSKNVIIKNIKEKIIIKITTIYNQSLVTVYDFLIASHVSPLYPILYNIMFKLKKVYRYMEINANFLIPIIYYFFMIFPRFLVALT